MRFETIEDFMIHLFNLKIKKPVHGNLILTLKGDKIINIKQEQSFKEEGEIRRK